MRYPELQMVESTDTATLGFKSNSFVEDEALFSVEELLAMELKNIRLNAENMAGKSHTVEDAVITIPPFYTAPERQAVWSAVELAGLRPLSLLSDGLAVGLNYATSRTFPVVNEGGKPELHLVYDIGAGSATATVLRFQGKTVKDVGKFNKTIQEVNVVGTGWDKGLGGDALNRLVLDDMISKFIDQPATKKANISPEQVRAHGRTMSKMWKESERLRQILSANSEAHANFEGLYSEDVNFKYKLTRTDFESLASSHQARVQAPIEKALEMAKLKSDELDSIILHGGAVRTPFIQRQLERVANKDKIRTNVNSDEAAVLGAGFRSATISPSFRVKEIRIADTAHYPVIASWTADGKEKTQKLFLPTSLVGPEKQVSFKTAKDFEFTLSQQISSTETIVVSKIQTLNLTDSITSLTSRGCVISDLNPKFSIRISPIDGLPEVVSGAISCEAQEAEKKGVVDGMKDFLGFGSKKDDQKPINIEDNESSSSSSSTSSTSSSTSSTESPTSSKAAQKPKEDKKKVVTIPLGLSTDSGTSTEPDRLQHIKDRLTAFDASDRSRVLRAETLNTLESYTYKLRDILQEEGFVTASTAAQREEISQKAAATSAWLYEDGADAARDVLKEKLDELRGLVTPIQKRVNEEKKRPEALKQLESSLKQAESMGNVIRSVLSEAVSMSSASEMSSSETVASSKSLPESETATSTPADVFEDLDETSTSTSTSETTSTTASPTPEPPLFTENDLSLVEDKRESIQKWLDEKLAEQQKLSATDDPVLLSSDLKAKAKELDGLGDLLLRRLQKPKPKPKKTKTFSKAAKKSTTSEVSSSTATETPPTPESDKPEPSTTSAPEPEPSPAQNTDTSSTDPGEWAETSMPEPPEMSIEDEMRIREEQQKIDEELAAERSSIVAKAKAAESKKSKKAKPTKKPKPKPKIKAKSKTKSTKSKEQSKEEGHSEL